MKGIGNRQKFIVRPKESRDKQRLFLEKVRKSQMRKGGQFRIREEPKGQPKNSRD